MVQPIPEGYRTVTPWLITRDTARLIDFVKEAFDAEELGRVRMEDGTIGHAEVRIGDSVVMMFDAGKDWPPTPGFIRLYLEDCDATFRRALEAGATSVTEIVEHFWGDRGGRVRDPLGNVWWLQTRVVDVPPEELESRAKEPKFVEAMRLATDPRTEFFPRSADSAR